MLQEGFGVDVPSAGDPAARRRPSAKIKVKKGFLINGKLTAPPATPTSGGEVIVEMVFVLKMTLHRFPIQNRRVCETKEFMAFKEQY